MTSNDSTLTGHMEPWQDFPDEEVLSMALIELDRVHTELGRIVDMHTELIGRVQAANRTPEQLRQARIEANYRRVSRAKERFSAGQLRVIQYLRVRFWIATKGRREDAVAAGKETVAELDLRPISSDFLKDKPVRLYTDQSDYLRASVWAKALELHRGGDREFLELCRRLAVSKGNISAVLDFTHKLEGLKKTKTPRGIRQVEGRLREISGWVPRIPGPPVPIVPADSRIVLHLVKESRPYHSNGFTSRSHNNFQAEVAAGLTPIVMTELGFPRAEGVEEFPEWEVVDGIQHHRLDLGPHYKPAAVDLWLEDFAWAAYQKAKRIRPAVIHASSGRRGYETALVGLALKEKTGLPLVYEVRSFFEGTWTGETSVEEKSEIFARRLAVEYMCLQAADHVLTIGEAMKAEIVGRGIPVEKISIVPNGVDLERFEPSTDPTELRIKYGITGFTFGYVSNMDHQRESQETLIDAAKILKRRGRNLTCVLVGSGARRAFLEQYAVASGVGDSVVFTGSVDHADISRYYALIDIFVVPRIQERASTFVTPLKPYEAMAMKRPVIASDLPALREILDPPSRGIVYEPGDVEMLADAIESLVDNPGERERMGSSGRNWLVSNRQWAMNGQVYAEVFANLQKNRGTQEVGAE